MKEIEKKYILSGVAILVLVALFFFLFMRERKIHLSLEDSGKSFENEAAQTPEISGNEGENAQKAETANSDDNMTSPNDNQNPTPGDPSNSQKKSDPETVRYSGKIIEKLVNWGYQKAESRSIDTIIIHSSYDAISGDPYSFSGILNEYKGIGVSPHYLIDREGKIYRLVEDKNIAYHAGESKMPDGRTGVNNFSIGIELMNTKTDKFTDKQYISLKYLIGYLKGKYDIKNILGHDDIAPGRKDDPWNFDWDRIK